MLRAHTQTYTHVCTYIYIVYAVRNIQLFLYMFVCVCVQRETERGLLWVCNAGVALPDHVNATFHLLPKALASRTSALSPVCGSSNVCTHECACARVCACAFVFRIKTVNSTLSRRCCSADFFQGGRVAPTMTTQSSSPKTAPRHAILVLVPKSRKAIPRWFPPAAKTSLSSESERFFSEITPTSSVLEYAWFACLFVCLSVCLLVCTYASQVRISTVPSSLPGRTPSASWARP